MSTKSPGKAESSQNGRQKGDRGKKGIEAKRGGKKGRQKGDRSNFQGASGSGSGLIQVWDAFLVGRGDGRSIRERVFSPHASAKDCRRRDDHA